MKDLLTILLLWFLFETDEEVIEPLEALCAAITALDLEFDGVDYCDVLSWLIKDRRFFVVV